ncbi:TIGR03619 family F420-dependent LLM class oxidoreductase [Streptomyces sp. NPDC057644]|uniref:TIGR03619 family F420-dependent LLM class oxidoreductase n=1 Tax=Streptomyces sp. NPDC057644 TaxID=3346191 RepID=UPI00369DB001
MRIGFSLPQFGAMARQAEQVPRFARQAEALGADSLWIGDRLLAPVRPTVGYAGTDAIPPEFDSRLDPFALMTMAATVTERPLIGSNVLNAPWYPPALLERSLTTIDLLSKGRLLVGLGVGWSPEEFQAVGVPMDQRGVRLDECLDAMESLWTADPADPAEYQGRYWTVPATRAALRPARRPRPPVYLGGWAPAALRRVARRADGWLPATVPGAGAFDAAAVNGPLARIRGLAEEYGRDPGAIDTVLRINPTATASLDDIVTTIAQAGKETDVDHVFVDLMYLAGDVDHALELAEKVLSAAR